MNRKTERKNKINQAINWSNQDDYFTVETLMKNNQHMVTDSGSDITLRVRLDKAINKEYIVVAIGTKNCGKGRPRLAFAMTPISPKALEKAKMEGVMLYDETKLVNIMEIKPGVPPPAPKKMNLNNSPINSL